MRKRELNRREFCKMVRYSRFGAIELYIYKSGDFYVLDECRNQSEGRNVYFAKRLSNVLPTYHRCVREAGAAYNTVNQNA